MLFDLQTFGGKRDTNTTQSAKEKVTDGSKLKSEQKRSAELEMMLSLLVKML